MLQWNVKFQAQFERILCLTFHFITVCAQCSKKVKMVTKGFWLSDDQYSIDSLVYTKRRGSLSVLFLKNLEKKEL